MRATPASVVVVDDDVDTCRNLSDILTDLGYHVDIAHAGPSALELVRRNAYDVALAVLIDMKLPEGDGVSVFRVVRRANPPARAIVITGHRPEREQQVQQVLDEGADAVCSKPFDLPELLATRNRLTREDRGPHGAPR
jgi:two-component system copper resistance phosphate regulon response regulator CusR